jgi:anaerobic selenocysteine-containing dehydrogenase
VQPRAGGAAGALSLGSRTLALAPGGARGEGKWKPISWDQAIGEVVAKLGKLRAAGHPERLVLIDGETGSFTYDLWARFLSAFGSPNHIGLGSARAAGVKLATLYTQGRYGLPAYDLDPDAPRAGHGHGPA